MDVVKGQIASWFHDKGFGFIRADGDGPETVRRAKEIAPQQRHPRQGDEATFTLIGSATDTPEAAHVTLSGFAWSLLAVSCVGLVLLTAAIVRNRFLKTVLLCVGLVLLTAAYVYCVWRKFLPFCPVATLYAAMSLLTLVVYYHDTCLALGGARRVPEIRLHLLELSGGWPGALLAKLFFRHKSQSPRFLFHVGLIVLVHCTLWCVWWFGGPIERLVKLSSQGVAHHPALHKIRWPKQEPLPVRESLEPNASPRSTRSWWPSQQAKMPPAPDEHQQAPTTEQDPGTGTKEQPSGEPAWADDPPAAPPIRDPTVRRTLVTADEGCRQAIGAVKAISLSRGILVALPPEIGESGVIAANTLVGDFHRRFQVGEQVRVAVTGISMSGSSRKINLVLVEPQADSAHSRKKRR